MVVILVVFHPLFRNHSVQDNGSDLSLWLRLPLKLPLINSRLRLSLRRDMANREQRSLFFHSQNNNTPLAFLVVWYILLSQLISHRSFLVSFRDFSSSPLEELALPSSCVQISNDGFTSGGRIQLPPWSFWMPEACPKIHLLFLRLVSSIVTLHPYG